MAIENHCPKKRGIDLMAGFTRRRNVRKMAFSHAIPSWFRAVPSGQGQAIRWFRHPRFVLPSI
ncbi:hypothetical protein BGLA2_610024 [Burkholderia gladioli]|nr:hypothetical protein BGLA2_610024 [Burkholderia gladioli]